MTGDFRLEESALVDVNEEPDVKKTDMPTCLVRATIENAYLFASNSRIYCIARLGTGRLGNVRSR